MGVTAGEALQAIRGYAKANRIVLSGHAWRRMQQRRVSHEDLRHALSECKSCKWQKDHETWKSTGPDVDGDDLDVAVVIEDGLIVVTVY